MKSITEASKINYMSGYAVFIIADRYKKTMICIADELNGFTVRLTRKFTRLVYYEKFGCKKKAVNKKRILDKSDREKIKKLVSKNNPEWLDIIFTINEEDLLH